MRPRKNVIKQGIDKLLALGKDTISKKKEIAEMSFDFVEKHFSTEDEFLDFLKEKEIMTSRAIVAAKEVVFYEITPAMEKRLLKAGYSDELIENTIINTCLACKIGKKLYLINSSSMQALRQKAFSRFDAIPPKIKAAMLNATISEASGISKVQDDVMPMVSCGKLASLMSGMYTPIVPFDFFQTGLRQFKDVIGKYEIVEAISTIVTYKIKLVFVGEKATNLQKMYVSKLKEYAKRRGIAEQGTLDCIANTDLRFGIIAGTDEAGNGSAYMRPYVNVGKTFGFEIGTPISVYHRGAATIIDNLTENIENMFSTFTDVVEKLSAAILTDIKNWRAVMDSICEELRIPNDVTNKLLVQFSKMYPGTASVTAYDIMMAILSSSNIYQNTMQPSDAAFGQYEARIAGVLNMDLAKYDYDPYALEVDLKSQIINDWERVLVQACDSLKLPKTIVNTLVSGMAAKVSMSRMMNAGEESPVTSWDIYETIMGSSRIYRDYMISRGVTDAEERSIQYEKQLRAARKLCFIKYDVA